MNSQQRKYLIDKITQRVNGEINALRSSIPKRPDLRAMILSELMQGKMKVRPSEELNELFKQKAFNKIEKGLDSNWLAEDDRYNSIRDTYVKLTVEEIFILPENYISAVKEQRDKEVLIHEKIKTLAIQLDTIEARITLASDKTLQKMINEVDDMGDISLIDTKIKLLG